MKNIRKFSEKIKNRIIEINIKRKEKFNNNNNIISSLLNKLLNKLDQVKIFNSTVAILNISILMKFQYTSNYNILMMPIIIMIILTTSNIKLSYSQSNMDSLIFEDPLSGVQFQYTAEWVKEGSSLFGPEAECSSLPCMKLPEISVSVYPIATADFSLENYTREESFYHNLSEGYRPIALNETTIGEDKKAFQNLYSAKSPLLMEEASNEITNYEIYTTNGINLYKISFMAILDEQYDKYLNLFKKMMGTFEITI